MAMWPNRAGTCEQALLKLISVAGRIKLPDSFLAETAVFLPLHDLSVFVFTR